jgi:hypothetical protein
MAIWKETGNGLVKTNFYKDDAGIDAYLCCPGPSLADVKNEDLQNNLGVYVFAINTAYPKIKPHVWIGLDWVECYDRNLWNEPFIKISRGGRSEKMFLENKKVKYLHNVFWASNKKYEDDSVIFGPHSNDEVFIWKKSTFITALHIILHMGFKRIHLLGNDMGGKKDYYDDRVLARDEKEKNKRFYKTQLDFLKWFNTEAIKNNVEVVSCTPHSPINEFLNYIPLKTALKKSKKRVETKPGKILHVSKVKNENNKKYKWTKTKLEHKKAVLTGCDQEQEWMLPWWYGNYEKNSYKYPLYFCDFGMSEKAKKWCLERGEIIEVDKSIKYEKVWFKKPYFLLEALAEKLIWVDLDCQVQKNLAPLLDNYGNKTIAMALDRNYMLNRPDIFKPGEIMYQNGVIVVKHGDPIVEDWCDYTPKHYSKHRGDNELLCRMLYETKHQPEVIPENHHWVRIDGENPEATIYHWHGLKGKELIKKLPNI